jgi:trigger factor
VTLTFRPDYHYKEVAGKTAEYTIRLSKVEEPTLPELDAAFFASFGVPEGGLDALRRDVADNMRRELEQVVRARVKTQVLNKLFAANPVELPRTRIGARDVSQIPPREQFEDAARQRVGLGLLVSEIIRREGIKADRSRVDTHLAELVAGHDQPGDMARTYQENAAAMHQIEARVLEDQVVDWLVARARITDQAASFGEVMNTEIPARVPKE